MDPQGMKRGRDDDSIDDERKEGSPTTTSTRRRVQNPNPTNAFLHMENVSQIPNNAALQQPQVQNNNLVQQILARALVGQLNQQQQVPGGSLAPPSIGTVNFANQMGGTLSPTQLDAILRQVGGVNNAVLTGRSDQNNHQQNLVGVMENMAYQNQAAAFQQALLEAARASSAHSLQGISPANMQAIAAIGLQRPNHNQSNNNMMNDVLANELLRAALGMNQQAGVSAASSSQRVAAPLAAGAAASAPPGAAGPPGRVSSTRHSPSPTRRVAATKGGAASQPIKKPDPSTCTITGRPPICVHVESDESRLTPYQCLARKHLEFFEATKDNVSEGAQGRNKAIVLGQVGIRCRFCKMLSRKEKAPAAAFYPAKLSGIYQSAQNIINTHIVKDCTSVSSSVRNKLLNLGNRKSAPGGGKGYWSDEAANLGIFEDDHGLRFSPLGVSDSGAPGEV